jgi:hypothetical protein
MSVARWMQSKAIVGVAAIAALIAGVPSAKAALVLTVTINGVPTTISDNSANDSNGATGQITYLDLSSPQFTGSVHVAISNSPGDATGGSLTISSTLDSTFPGDPAHSIPADTGGHIIINAVDSGFTSPAVGADLLGTAASLTSVGTETGTFQGYGNATTTGPKLLTGPSGNDFSSTPFNYVGSYSLTANIDTVVPANDLVNVSETVTITPEPASMALMGIAAAAMMARRRRA